jgi:hypothetical protein
MKQVDLTTIEKISIKRKDEDTIEKCLKNRMQSNTFFIRKLREYEVQKNKVGEKNVREYQILIEVLDKLQIKNWKIVRQLRSELSRD